MYKPFSVLWATQDRLQARPGLGGTVCRPPATLSGPGLIAFWLRSGPHPSYFLGGLLFFLLVSQGLEGH